MPSNLQTLVTLTILILAVFVEAGHPESHSRLFSADLFPSGLFPPVQSLERHRRNAQGFVCTSEGYHPDPHNCRVYHRCVDWGNGRPLTVFDFECGEGTVFSPTKGNICTFPQESGRPECSGNDNEIDSTFPSTSQTPSTQWTTQEVSTSTKTTTSPTTTTQNLTTTKQPQRPPPPTTTNPPTTSSQRPGTGGQGGNNGQIRCTQEGFLADPINCKKFYRCVNEGSGQFAKYAYVCGEGTVWDPKIQGCNYPWAASRKDCKDGSGEGGSNEDNNGQWNGDNSGQWNGDTGDNGGQWNGDTGDNGGQWDGNTGGPIPPGGSNGQTGQPGTAGSSGTPGTPGTPAHASEPGECPGEGFFPDPEDCRKFYRCVGNGPVYLVYDFQCSPGTAWDPSVQSCNHDYLVPNCKNGSTTSGDSGTTEPITPSSGTSESGVTEPTSHPPPTNSTSSSNQTTGGTTPTPGSSQCPGEGFFPNPDDCTKFFRCVSTDHGLQRYDFKCAPGTAWDQKIVSCNYIDQVDSCKGSSGTTPGSTSTTAKPGTTSTKVPGTATNASSTTENTPSPTPKPSTVTSTTSSTSSTSTESNTPSSISPNSTTETSTTPSTSTSSTAETSTPPSTSTSSSTETGTPPSTPSNATTETTTPSSTSNTSSTEPTTPDCTKKPNSTIVCTEPGYFPHPTECAKFYRCVDNGKGFNVYIFDCAPGTIFDPSIDACNYPESVYPPRDCAMPTQGTPTPTSSTTEQTTTTTGSTETATPVSSSLTTAVNTESTTEGTTESTSEATTTSTSETATESTSEAITESTSEATTESTSEATTSSTSEGTTSSTPEGTTESTSVATEESTSEGTTQSTSEATTASTTEGTTESTSETTVESTSEATTESTSEGTTESTSVATAETTSEATTQSTSEATTESTSEATTESTSEATTESTSEATTESSSTTVTTESSTEGTTESSTVIATETTEMSTTGSTSTPSATWTPTTEPTTTSTPCPIGNLTNEQIALVCPTSFRRHPKYCNLFYQCTSDRSMDIKVLILSCPTGTIYDDRKVQCLPEDESSEPCTGTIAVERFYRKLTESSISPVEVSTYPLCPSEGYHAYKRGCGNAFYKCSRDYKNDIQGYLYKCPPNYFYWSVSRRCEHAIRLPICVINAAHTSAEWDKRWQVPIEDFNLDTRSLDLF